MNSSPNTDGPDPALRASASISGHAVGRTPDHGFFPYAVIRRAGTSALSLQRVIFDRTVALLDQWADLQQETLAPCTELVESLERVIGEIPKGPERLELIRLKRNIFNDRVPTEQLSSEARDHLEQRLSAEEAVALRLWMTGKCMLEKLLGELKNVFVEEFAGKERLLRGLCRKKEFRGGLEFASPSLGHDIASYLELPDSFAQGHKTRVMRSIVRYYSRSALKLSPFSSFMRSRIVRIVPAADYSARYSKSVARRHVSLNRTFIGQLAYSISQHPELRRFVPLYANDAILERGPRILLMHHQYKKKGTRRLRIPGESIADLPHLPIFDTVWEFLRQSGRYASLDSLVSELEKPLGGAEQAKDFIESLIDAGLLKHRVPLPEDDSTALTAFLEFLAGIENSDGRLDRLAGELEKLESLMRVLEDVSPEQLPQTLREIHAIGGSAHHALGDPRPPDWSGHLAFENVIEEPVGQMVVPANWMPAVDDLQRFLTVFVPLLDTNSCVRESMRVVLEREFQGGPLQFLRFAAQYCKSVEQVSRNYKGSDRSRNPFALNSLSKLEQIWSEIAARSIGEENEVDLKAAAEDERWVERFNQLGLAGSIEGRLPVTCFLQPCLLEGGRPGVVANNVLSGPWGSLMRTCCGMHDQESKKVLSDLAEELKGMWDQAVPCAVRATFDFNPNLSSSITEQSINYLGDPTVTENVIPIGSIWIAMSEAGNIRLTVGGQDIAPVSFGSLARQLQPPMARLLLAAAGAEPVTYSRLVARTGDHASVEKSACATPSPRYSYGSCIVRRRGWHVSRELLPSNEKGESPLTYFARARQWQRNLSLPDEVFVQFRSQPETGSQLQRARAAVLRKPNYVDFRNYFLVESLGNFIQESRSGAYFEEALPRLADWRSMGVTRPIELAVDICLRSPQYDTGMRRVSEPRKESAKC